MLSGFRNIRMNAELKQLVAESKQRIIDYYNQNGPAVIQRAQSLMSNQDYEGSIAELAAIPQECSSYPKASSLMLKVYKENINHSASQMLLEAKAIWAADPNPGESADQALAILGQINTGATCYNQAQALIKQIQARAKQVTDRQYADEQAQARHEREIYEHLPARAEPLGAKGNGDHLRHKDTKENRQRFGLSTPNEERGANACQTHLRHIERG